MTKLVINTGNVCVLKSDKDFFSMYDRIIINTANAVFSSDAYRELSEHGMTVNSAKLDIIDIEGEPIYIGSSVIDGSTDFSGKYIIGNNIQITKRDALRGVAGLIAEVIIAPEGTRFDFKVNGKIHYYPEGAEVINEDIRLDKSFASNRYENSVIWTQSTVNALDDSAVADISEKCIKIHCGHLLISESSKHKHGNCFTTSGCDVIPDGFDYIDESITLTAINAVLYGKKLYIKYDLTVMPDAVSVFEQLNEVIVSGNALIPYESVPHWKKIGSSKSVKVYKGSLWMVKGKENISHEQLEAAAADELNYTLMVNGMVIFEPDVTKSDLACITEIYYNGVISISDALIPLLKSKIVEGNGTIMPHKQMNDSIGDISGSDSTIINVAEFIRV